MPLLRRKKRTLETLNISSSPRRTGDEAAAVIDTKQVRSDNSETPSSLAENILLSCTSVCYSELLTRTATSSLQPVSSI
ncbi:mCG148258 [Mus musculus]|nr:mCG148258 [Mus musculus]